MGIEWNQEKLDLLTKLYPTHTADELTDTFGTSAIAITQRANKMGLRKDKAFRQSLRTLAFKKAYDLKQAIRQSKHEVVRNISTGKLIIKGNVTTHIGA